MIFLDPDLDPGRTAPAKAARTAPARIPPASTKKSSQSSVVSVSRAERIPSVRTLAKFLAEAQAVVRLRGQVSVLLTTDHAIRRLNRDFRGKDKPTDVLSFPAEAGFVEELVAGDLAISIPTALKQAREQHHALLCELKILILHGLLHLAGYDHETDRGQMARRERTLREKLRLPVGLIERAGGVAKSAAGGKKTPERKALPPKKNARVKKSSPPKKSAPGAGR